MKTSTLYRLRLSGLRSYMIPLCCSIVLVVLSGCGASRPPDPHWSVLAWEAPDHRLTGVWENQERGHVVSISSDGIQVFHRLNDFCIADTGVVPRYSLYAFDSDTNELHLHYYDYRDHPELLQMPAVFHRIPSPPACQESGTNQAPLSPQQTAELVWESFDHFYAAFDERGVDWDAIGATYLPRAESLQGDDQLFELLSGMLAPLHDSHVNLYMGDRRFNAGQPSLRARLVNAWKTSGSSLSEGEYVSAWHRGVLSSVYPSLDPDSLRSGANGAVEWGTIGGAAGYLRVNRFHSFSAQAVPRQQQLAVLRETLATAVADLADTQRLILDVALNGGGNDAAALTTAAFFADQTRDALVYNYRHGPSRVVKLVPAEHTYTRPIYLVTSEVTASAAEAFVLAMRCLPHVRHAGEPTRGGLSSLLPKPFPGDLLVTIAYEHVLDSNGAGYEGVGIPPHHAIALFPDSDLDGAFILAITRLAHDMMSE